MAAFKFGDLMTGDLLMILYAERRPRLFTRHRVGVILASDDGNSLLFYKDQKRRCWVPPFQPLLVPHDAEDLAPVVTEATEIAARIAHRLVPETVDVSNPGHLGSSHGDWHREDTGERVSNGALFHWFGVRLGEPVPALLPTAKEFPNARWFTVAELLDMQSKKQLARSVRDHLVTLRSQLCDDNL